MNSPRLTLEDAARILDSGGVLVLDTDTLPGFHCRADQAEAVQRIARIKGRSPDKPLLVLAADLAQAGQIIGSLTPRQRNYCSSCWPGPFSLILPASGGLADEVTAGSGTVAVRVPDQAGLLTLLQAVGHPLVSTSVNCEGQAPAVNLDQAEAGFAALVDGVYGCPSRTPVVESSPVASALIDLTVWPPRLLRPGPLPAPVPAP